jgi:glyceraldehyde 3-phosphate dehydrogenase
MVNVSINGFGRIGRLCYKILSKKNNIKIQAINCGSDPEIFLHLLKYDSTYGVDETMKDLKIFQENDEIFFVEKDKKIKIFSEKNIENLSWKQTDILLECTGKFTDRKNLENHLKNGAKKVILSCPAKDKIKSIVLGVNENCLGKNDDIISISSCTTNCASPILKIIDEEFGIESAFLTTVHAYTSDQNLLDGSHRDFRRARSAARSIIPTSSGAGENIEIILPNLKGKIKASALRVPVENGSIIDVSLILKKNISKEEVNNFVKLKSKSFEKKIIQYCSDPIVSIDIIKNEYSCVFDSCLTEVLNEKNLKIFCWYDNEFAYAYRMCDTIDYLI